MNKLLGWLSRVMSDKDGTPSSKRFGMIAGCLMACLSVCSLLGVLVGLSLGVPPQDYVNVYNNLLDTLVWLIGLLLTGGVVGYTSTRKLENKEKE